MNLHGTKTEANLLTAFAGEAQAYTKYQFYANRARKDGYMQIAAIFEETAGNEQAHAALWLRQLQDGSLPGTLQNLSDAAGGEHYEWSDMYARFAADARAEGFENLAIRFEKVGQIEKAHEDRYRKLIANMEGGLVFSRDGDAIWQCLNCGHIVVGGQPPMVCPVCDHPQSYFQLKPENY